MTDRAPPNWSKLAFITVPAIVLGGTLMGIVSGGSERNGWYNALLKPSFTPPGWVFPIAWTILYALIGVALAMILAEPRSTRRKAALTLFFVQLALNFAWSPIFFAAHDIRLAKVVIFIMAALAAAAAGQFMRLRRPAGLLLIPYLAWLVFAATLNSTIKELNPDAGTSLLG